MSSGFVDPENDRPTVVGEPETVARPPQVPVAAEPRPTKSPAIAFLLSALFPGIGQVYNGQPAKGLGFFLGFVGSIYATVEINPLPYGFFIPFVVLFNLVDAWRSASLVATRGVLEREETAESPLWGATLVVLGGLLLLNNLGWLDLARLSRFWPLLLIVVGVVFIRRSVQRRKGTNGPAG
jgi:Domain of unknown function (DUF5668)